VSRPWRSELRLHLQRQGCRAWLRGGWGSRGGAAGLVRVPGRPADSLGAAVRTLRERLPGGAWRSPLRVTLTLSDELAYYALLPADGPWARREERASEHFAATLGLQELTVRVSLAPGARHWLAAAVESRALQVWRGALQAEGLPLVGVRPALVEDLRAVAGEVRGARSLLVLPRGDGAMLLRIEEGALHSLAWERLDLQQPSLLTQRVQAFSGGEVLPVLLAVTDDADTAPLRECARRMQWRWLPLPDGPSKATAEEPAP
jgi:hypothetical protein